MKCIIAKKNRKQPSRFGMIPKQDQEQLKKKKHPSRYKTTEKGGNAGDIQTGNVSQASKKSKTIRLLVRSPIFPEILRLAAVSFEEAELQGGASTHAQIQCLCILVPGSHVWSQHLSPTSTPQSPIQCFHPPLAVTVVVDLALAEAEHGLRKAHVGLQGLPHQPQLQLLLRLQDLHHVRAGRQRGGGGGCFNGPKQNWFFFAFLPLLCAPLS